MIEPLHDNLLVEPIKESGKSPGGIVLPERAQKDPKFGTVQYIGPDVKSLQPGDVVVLPNWENDRIEVDGVEYMVLLEKNISVKL